MESFKIRKVRKSWKQKYKEVVQHVETVGNIVDTNPIISVTSLNINSLNAPSKIKIGRMDQNTGPNYTQYPRNSTKIQRHTRLKLNGWRKCYHANINQKKTGGAILLSDKADFKAGKFTWDTEGHNDKQVNSLKRYNNP